MAGFFDAIMSLMGGEQAPQRGMLSDAQIGQLLTSSSPMQHLIARDNMLYNVDPMLYQDSLASPEAYARALYQAGMVDSLPPAGLPQQAPPPQGLAPPQSTDAFLPRHTYGDNMSSEERERLRRAGMPRLNWR